MPRATAFSVGYAPMCCDHRRLRSVSVVSSNAPAAIRRQPDIFRGSFDVAANDRRAASRISARGNISWEDHLEEYEEDMWSINAGDSDLTFGLPADGQNMPSKAKPKKSKKKKPIGQASRVAAANKMEDIYYEDTGETQPAGRKGNKKQKKAKKVKGALVEADYELHELEDEASVTYSTYA